MHSVRLIAVTLIAVSVSVCVARTYQITGAERQRLHAERMTLGIDGDIPRLLKATTGNITLREQVVIERQRLPEDPDRALEALVCTNKAVVVGRAGTPASFVNANQGFLYTEWPFTVVEVIKGRPEVGVRPQASITILEHGGSLVLDGRRVIALMPNGADRYMPGEAYLLFIHDRFPHTGAFFSADALNLERSELPRPGDFLSQLRKLPPTSIPGRARTAAMRAAARPTCDSFSRF